MLTLSLKYNPLLNLACPSVMLLYCYSHLLLLLMTIGMGFILLSLSLHQVDSAATYMSTVTNIGLLVVSASIPCNSLVVIGPGETFGLMVFSCLAVPASQRMAVSHPLLHLLGLLLLFNYCLTLLLPCSISLLFLFSECQLHIRCVSAVLHHLANIHRPC